ncbi:MAG: hypothetical protein E7295_01765 [Lachnospiraceae bacterium]|jgi:two-component sensor histidine kinase|nr:hypothetical protein [Lachnospiraceae bacterium]
MRTGETKIMIKNVAFISALAPLILLLCGLSLTVLLDQYLKKDSRDHMIAIIVLCFSLMAQNLLEYWLRTGTAMPFWRTFTSAFGYCVRPMIMVMFLCIVQPGRSHWISWSLFGINTAIYLTSFHYRLAFYITEDNRFLKGPLGDTCLVVSSILLGNLFLQTLKSFQGGKRREMLIPLFVVVMIVVAVLMDRYFWEDDQPVEYLTIAVIVSCVFFYSWLHLQFVREHEQDLMAQNRIKIMMSQIQPHFLFNTLSSIQYLCMSDPEQAALITGKFARYLRQNLDSLGQTELIPVSRELEHVAVYTEIEKIRFPYIHVEYDVSDENFKVPALTIQPLVENAIRHGGWEEGEGRVTITIKRGEAFHEILIEDDGRGFDPALPESTDKSHVGIKNVRERVEKMCHGTLTLDSAPEKGTRVRVIIPEETK